MQPFDCDGVIGEDGDGGGDGLEGRVATLHGCRMYAVQVLSTRRKQEREKRKHVFFYFLAIDDFFFWLGWAILLEFDLKIRFDKFIFI